MPHDLHLDPGRLGAHSVTAAGLAEELHAALHGPPEALTAGEECVHAAVRRAAAELAELAAALAGAVAAYESADRDAARPLGVLDQR